MTVVAPPLAEVLRPKTLDEYIGQQHLVGKDSILRRMLEAGSMHSMIFWGPPGVGKTTLANIIALSTIRPFYTLSAINSGVREVREVIGNARNDGTQPILFIDEIHRFSKSQQDSLLGAVEKGIVILIGATTENPSFEVISPLLSRCQVYILKPLEEADLMIIAERARILLEKQFETTITISENEALLRLSGGDARKLLNAMELVVKSQHAPGVSVTIDNKTTLEVIQQNLALYDKAGEMHYDVISAFIKSLRGSDPNAAVYWLARMITAGEDLLFIARRMVILASEDIGNANPNALLLANACFDAVNKIGYPESRIILAQTAVYLATSPKSNASYMAIEEALAAVQKSGDLPVPLHLRNAPTGLMKDLGYSKNYQYAHDFEGNFVEMEFMPAGLSGKKFYDPGKNARENDTRERLKRLWKDRYGY
ncbi:MAG TPA: replication-associated recombination protein A [Bacteroidales bacterium]|nr:replication-associated recombination protein A [Bacteroidales bacterium]HPT01869.1 replication-associated recombination protein A [Bacteroidales bacterium]